MLMSVAKSPIVSFGESYSGPEAQNKPTNQTLKITKSVETSKGQHFRNEKYISKITTQFKKRNKITMKHFRKLISRNHEEMFKK